MQLLSTCQSLCDVMCVCVCVCVCVCMCVHVCECVSVCFCTKTHDNLKFEYTVVYGNSLEKFDIGPSQIKVTMGLRKYFSIYNNNNHTIFMNIVMLE